MSSLHDWVSDISAQHDTRKPFAPENGRPLRFAIGDAVIYTNDAGVQFRLRVTGFYRPVKPSGLYACGARYLLNGSAPWMPVSETAFYESPEWQRDPRQLRQRLTEREIDASRHPLVRFVGLDAYEQAGGGIRRDLFAENDAGVYLTDAALLERLAQDKLTDLAATVRAEGWAWVDVTPAMTYADLNAFERAPKDRREPTKREAQRMEKLQSTDSPAQYVAASQPRPQGIAPWSRGRQPSGRGGGRARCERPTPGAMPQSAYRRP